MDDITELEGAVADLEAQLADMKNGQTDRRNMSFAQRADEIRKSHNCSPTDAWAKARKEYPGAFHDFQGHAPEESVGGDYATLVEAEIRKG
jgi:hypothetical protein